MKVTDRLVLSNLRPQLCSSQDPLQFAYQPHVGVEDAVTYLHLKPYFSPDRPNSIVNIMFFDFTSTFKTIQPRLLWVKLQDLQVEASLVTWIVGYLTRRLQLMILQGCVSDLLIRSLCSPFLFISYTADCKYCSESSAGIFQ